MINTYIKDCKKWYELRDLREKTLLSFLSWAFIYALFTLFFFNPIATQTNNINLDILKTNSEIMNWQMQILNLQKLPSTPIYKEWVKTNNTYLALQNKYKEVLGKSISEKFNAIFKAVLSNYPNITLEQIQDSPEVLFQVDTQTNTNSDFSIFQQQAEVTATGNFQDIVGYLSYLENAVPNIHWDSMSYQVIQYPQARVETGFSVLYEKSKT